MRSRRKCATKMCMPATHAVHCQQSRRKARPTEWTGKLACARRLSPAGLQYIKSWVPVCVCMFVRQFVMSLLSMNATALPSTPAKAGVAHSDCGWTCGCAGKTVRSFRTRAVPERFCDSDSLRRGTISRVCTFTFTFMILSRRWLGRDGKMGLM